MHTTTQRPETSLPTMEVRRRFDWLQEKNHRRSALAKIHHAVLNGWDIDAEGRAILIQELGTLLESGELTPRETIRVCRIFLAMGQTDIKVQAKAHYRAACAAGLRPCGRPRSH